MKSIKELLLDESPKGQKKLEKMLAKTPVCASYLEAAKAEARSANALEFPKLRMLVTDSFLCYHDIGIGASFVIYPISCIRNLYRTNIIGSEYDYSYFALAIEFESSTGYLMRYPRSGNGLEIYNDVIAAVKARMAVNGGTQL